MRFPFLVLLIWTISQTATASEPNIRPMGFAMPFQKGVNASEVTGNPNGSGVVTIDASAFGDRAGQVCEWLVTPSPRRPMIEHTVYGQLANGRLSLLPEFEGHGTNQFGSVKLELNYFDQLELHSSEAKADTWYTMLAMNRPVLSEQYFTPVGLLTRLQSSFFSALTYLEDGKSGSTRSPKVTGKLQSQNEFQVESIAVRLSFNRIQGMSVGTQDFVIIEGELSKGVKGYRVTSKSGTGFYIKLMETPAFGVPQSALNLNEMLHKTVVVQGIEGARQGTLEVYPGADTGTFVRLSSSFSE